MSQGDLLVLHRATLPSFVFFVIDQGYLYDEEREEYEKRERSRRFRLPTLKLTAMGLRWNDGFFLVYTHLYLSAYGYSPPRTPKPAWSSRPGPAR